MELIKNIMNNQWVVNIGTGMVVYIITTIISKVILNKATDNEKQKQIQKANNEIIRILKPYVVEKNILTEIIINSVKKSVAREYNLLPEEIYSVKDICEELTREILQSAYVDNQTKTEYISYLNNVIENVTKEKDLKKNLEIILKYNQLQMNRKSGFFKGLRIWMMIIVVLICIIITMFEENKINSFFYLSEPVQITILIILLEVSLLYPILCDKILKNIKKLKKKIKKKKSEMNKNENKD